MAFLVLQLGAELGEQQRKTFEQKDLQRLLHPCISKEKGNPRPDSLDEFFA